MATLWKRPVGAVQFVEQCDVGTLLFLFLCFCLQANETPKEAYIPKPTASDCATGYELLNNCTTNEFLGAPIGVTSIYPAALTGMFFTAAILHPSEAFCLIHGVWYILCLPAGYIFLFVYSLCNYSQSWGTREAKSAADGSKDGKTKTITKRIAKFILTLKQVQPPSQIGAVCVFVHARLHKCVYVCVRER